MDHSKMLTVRVYAPGLQYDINAILKAFFPDRDIRVLEPDCEVHDKSILDLPLYMDVKEGAIDIQGRTYEYDPDECETAKDSFRLKLYDVMCTETGRTLPWGNLTGVRPVKIALLRLRKNESEDEIRRYFLEHHKVSNEKCELAMGIARRESDLLSKTDYKRGYSLYIGIPFCPTTCLYCSFASNPYGAYRDRIDDYLNALYKEIDFVADELIAGKLSLSGYPDSIYIGGGTPTSLSEDELDRLLGYLTDRIDVSKSLEFTCEAGRPDSITAGKLSVMKKYGVGRISVNPQTMQQKTLDIIGRKGTPADVIEAFCMARNAGFDNINMDIILGLPGENEAEVADTLTRIKKLGPDSLTVHSLAIKRASALKERLDEIGISALNNTDKTMELAAAAAEEMGMKPYYLYRQKNMSGNFENTGYAVPGKECLYNILIMEEVQSIVALGAGSVSKRVIYDENDPNPSSITRCENPKDLSNYITRIDEMIERKRDLLS